MDNSLVSALLSFTVSLITVFASTFIADHYRRFRDKSALAGALAGELASYLEAGHLLTQQLPLLIKRAEGGEKLRFPKIELPRDRVFESCVAQIGLLGPELAAGTAYVYNNIGAFRIAFFAAGHDEMEPQMQAATLTGALEALLRAMQRGLILGEKLDTCAKDRYAAGLPQAIAIVLIFFLMLTGAFFLGRAIPIGATGEPQQSAKTNQPKSESSSTQAR